MRYSRRWLLRGKGLLKQAIKHLGRQQDDDNLDNPSPPGERLGARCWVHDLEQRVVHQVDGKRTAAQIDKRGRRKHVSDLAIRVLDGADKQAADKRRRQKAPAIKPDVLARCQDKAHDERKSVTFATVFTCLTKWARPAISCFT